MLPLSCSTCPTTLPPKLRCRRYVSAVEFSPDAQRIAAVDPEGVSILDAKSRAEVVRLPVPGVLAVAFSPKGTYLTTYQKPVKAEGGGIEKNLKVRRRRRGDELLEGDGCFPAYQSFRNGRH